MVTSPSSEKEQEDISMEEESSSEEQVSMEKEDDSEHMKSKPSNPATASSADSGEVKKSITTEQEKLNETHTEEQTSTEEEEEEEESDHNEEIEETLNPEPSKRSGTTINEKKSSGSQNKLFKRVWSEEDELLILNEMASFFSKEGKDPSIHCETFLLFVKDRLQANPTMTQLKDKMYRLKKRFETNSRRRIISNSHEKKIFQLSKKVWDLVDSGQQGENPKSKPKSKLKPETDVQGGHEVVVLEESRDHGRDLLFSEMSKVLNVNELKRGLGSLENSKRKKLEEEWMNLHDEENDLAVKRTRTIAKHVEVIVEALKSSRG